MLQFYKLLLIFLIVQTHGFGAISTCFFSAFDK